MDKKYLETKNNSLESSVLGVWKTAIEEGEAIRDAAQMTKEVTKEEVDLDEVYSVEEIEEEISELDDLIKELDEGILKNIGKAVVKTAGRAAAGVAKKAVGKVGGSKVGKAFGKVKSGVKKAKAIGGKIKKAAKTGTAYGDEYDPMLERLEIIESKLNDYYNILEEAEIDENPVDTTQLPNMREALLQVRTEKHDTHVDPKDREELDKEVDGEGGVETAKKMKKAKEPAPNISEASGDKEAYKKFFDAALKKFKVSSPAELKGDQKKKFFDYIDKNWEGDNEKAEAAMSQVREFKIQSMKAALAQVWGMEEGKNPFKKEDDEENKKKVKTETGKKPAVIDLQPKIKD